MSQHERLHALDGLRAAMMLLGLVLHAAISYVVLPANHAWTFRDPARSFVLDVAVGFIHAFRMPTFMFLAGFFAALLAARRGIRAMLRNRAWRIGLPFALGLPLLVPLTVAGFAFAETTAATGSRAEGLHAAAAEPWLQPVTIHLWFLYFLLYYYAAAGLLAALPLPAPLRALPARLLGTALRSRYPSGLLALPLVLLLQPTIGSLGVSFTLVPEPVPLLTYGYLFACGWLYFGHREHMQTLRNRRRTLAHLGASVGLFAVYGLVFHPAMTAVLEGRAPDPGLPWLAAVAGALLVWHALWGLLGLFLLTLDRSLPAVRYVVDGSYWVYLVHLPLTIWLPGLLVPLPWPASVKFTLVLATTTVVCFASYELCVRSTVIGQLLNGRRWPRALLTASRRQPAPRRT